MKTENDSLKNAINGTGLPILAFTAYVIVIGTVLCLLFDMMPEINRKIRLDTLPLSTGLMVWSMISLVIGAVIMLILTIIHYINLDYGDSEVFSEWDTPYEKIKSTYIITGQIATVAFLIGLAITLLVISFSTIVENWVLITAIIGLTWAAIASYRKFKKETEK